MASCFPCCKGRRDGETVQARDVQDRVAEHVGLTEEQRDEVLDFGQLRFRNRIGWAVSSLARTGALTRPAPFTTATRPTARSRHRASSRPNQPRGGAGAVLAGFRVVVAVWVVSELGEHPGTEDDAQTGLTGVDLSVRVPAKILGQHLSKAGI